MNAPRALRLAALLLLAALFSACKVDLYSSLSEQEANAMLAVLAAQRIAASKEPAGDKGWNLRVEERDMGAALDALRARGLPHDRFKSLGDMFPQQGLVSTPAEERMRYIHGISQELSHTLQTIDGVILARVHVVIPANDPLSDKIRPSSAAVFIKHTPDTDLRTLAPSVKGLVAHAIEGLSHEQVSLTMVEGRVPPAVTAQPVERVGDAPLLSAHARTALVFVLALGLAALASLPYLLARERLDWRSWVARVWKRA